MWPVLLVFGLRRLRSTHRVALVLLGGALAVATLRAVVFESGRVELAMFSTFTRADGIMIGSALGLGIAAKPRWLMKIVAHPITGVLGGGTVIAISLLVSSRTPFLHRAGFSLANVGVALLIGHLVTGEEAIVRRILSKRPLVATGRISYSLYLFHVPVIFIVQAQPGLRGSVAGLVSTFVASLSIGAASFAFVETPILRFKRRFTVLPTARTTALA